MSPYDDPAVSAGEIADYLHSLTQSPTKMNEPFFKLDYYDLNNAEQAEQYRKEVYAVALRFSEAVNMQAEFAKPSERGNYGFYRSNEGEELAIELLERWPEDFADEDRVSDQQRAEAIQLQVCHDVLVGVDADWMDETDEDEEDE